MTTNPDERIELDANVIGRLASLICGDDIGMYRPGHRLVAFFRTVGWRPVDDVDGPRRAWVVGMLTRRNLDDGALRRVILRLADPREYIDEVDAMDESVAELNRLLSVEGLRVELHDGRPDIVSATPRIPVQKAGRVVSETFLEPDEPLSKIVSDSAFGDQLQARLEEAKVCRDSGAPTAAVIMMGSLLEGVLYDIAVSENTSGEHIRDNLQKLIDLAAERQWVARDVHGYMHVLRDHRNLVHPKKQYSQGYSPEGDVVRIAWNVVVAALNDLAAFRRRSGTVGPAV